MLQTLENLFTGLTVGDAYGAGLEFQDRNWIRTHVDFTKFINRRNDINTPDKKLFTIDYHDWDYTDDAEMTIAVTKAICSGKPFTDELLVNAFVDEYELGYQQKGYKRNGHGAMRWYFSGEKTIAEIRDMQRNKTYPGNAPPMRASPIGLLPEALIDQYATVNATCTHPHPKAIASSILIARASQAMLVLAIAPEKLLTHCSGFISDEETIRLLQLADALPAPDTLQENDYVILCGPQPLDKAGFIEGLYGLPSNATYTAVAALYVLKHSRSAFEALRHSINIGGDVDSLASITTGIAAGRYGIGSLPAYMLEHTEGMAYVKTVAGEFEMYLRSR